MYDVPATLTIDGQTFKDAFDHGAQRRTFSGIITDSMNTGTVLVGQKLSKEERYNWLKKYGVGEFTGIELTGEQQGRTTIYRLRTTILATLWLTCMSIRVSIMRTSLPSS